MITGTVAGGDAWSLLGDAFYDVCGCIKLLAD
ncbi:hypothetical protein ES702_06820 [subsurface metagenome]